MIDRTKLESLLGGNPQMVQKFLNIFKSQTPEQLILLKDSIAEENWSQASITAHAIKSQCRYLGLEDIADNAFKIEQLTEEKRQLNLTPGLAAKLKEHLMEVIEIELR